MNTRSLGKKRSPKWEKFERAFIKTHPNCAVCNTVKKLEAHHMLPFHIHPELELDEENLITLCRPHHFLFGHFEDWKSYNKTVAIDTDTWRRKIKNRYV